MCSLAEWPTRRFSSVSVDDTGHLWLAAGSEANISPRATDYNDIWRSTWSIDDALALKTFCNAGSIACAGLACFPNDDELTWTRTSVSCPASQACHQPSSSSTAAASSSSHYYYSSSSSSFPSIWSSSSSGAAVTNHESKLSAGEIAFVVIVIVVAFVVTNMLSGWCCYRRGKRTTGSDAYDNSLPFVAF